MVRPRRLRKQPTRTPKMILRWTGPWPLTREEAAAIKREIKRSGEIVIIGHRYLHAEVVEAAK